MEISQENIYKQWGVLKELSLPERKKLLEAVGPLQKSKFLGFALRLSTSVLTSNNKEKDLVTALLCLIMENFTQDPRDNIGVLALLNNSANEVGLDLDTIIKEVVRVSGENALKYFNHWIDREDKSIEVFGFSEIRDSDYKLIGYNSISFNE